MEIYIKSIAKNDLKRLTLRNNNKISGNIASKTHPTAALKE